MRIGPDVDVQREGSGEYRITFHLTDGPHVRIASDTAQMVRIIERVLPGYQNDPARNQEVPLPAWVVRAQAATLPPKVFR